MMRPRLEKAPRQGRRAGAQPKLAQLIILSSASSWRCCMLSFTATPNHRAHQNAVTTSVAGPLKQLVPQLTCSRFTQRFICAPTSFIAWLPYISDQLLALYLISREVRTYSISLHGEFSPYATVHTSTSERVDIAKL